MAKPIIILSVDEDDVESLPKWMTANFFGEPLSARTNQDGKVFSNSVPGDGTYNGLSDRDTD